MLICKVRHILMHLICALIQTSFKVQSFKCTMCVQNWSRKNLDYFWNNSSLIIILVIILCLYAYNIMNKWEWKYEFVFVRLYACVCVSITMCINIFRRLIWRPHLGLSKTVFIPGLSSGTWPGHFQMLGRMYFLLRYK